MSDQPVDLSAARARLALRWTGVQLQSTRELLLVPGGDAVFRRLVEGVQDYAIFMLTPEGVIASWNAGAQLIKGYGAEEVIGKHFSIFYAPEAVAAEWPAEELRRASLHGRFEDEGWRVRKDGSRFWANVVISALRDDNGTLVGYSKVTRDLTQRRNQEERLRESERNLRLLVDGVQVYAIFSLDAKGFITSWNLGAQRIKGYAAREVIGEHFSMFYEKESVARGWPQEELKRATALGRYEDEGWRVCKDGARIWANVVITAIRDEDGELIGFSKVTRDLTERRRHEEQLREREENLRLLVEGVKDHAMYLLDAKGRIRTWNAGAKRLLGFESDHILLVNVAALYPEDERAAGQPEAELAAAGLAGFGRFQGWRQKADGQKFLAETSTTALRLASGQLRGYVQIVRDLTGERRVEELESEGRRIGEFIAMLSHELRNPLAPIKSAMAVLGKYADRPEAAWCVDLVNRQVAHLTRMVDDLLDVSRVTRGKVRLEPIVLELNTLVQMAADTVRAAAAAHDLTLNISLNDGPVLVQGDSTRLTQVVVNLLNNAIKYTASGGRVDVTVASDAESATLRVVDTGIGMTPELQAQAFEPFVQGARSLGRAEGGLGIGLTLVKRIVELHGGSVCAYSAGAGQGSTLEVSLPITGSAMTTAPPENFGPVGSAKVLVVDDNRDAAESLAMLLRLSGHEVQVAYDGLQAIAFGTSFVPDMVLLDIGMPHMDGYQVARVLRSTPGLERCRLIALTGYGQDSDRQATADVGFEAHLTKPIDSEELARVIEAGVQVC